MKAIVLRGTGGPEQLKYEDFPDPTAAVGEVVVRLETAALNHRDVWVRRGLYPGIQLPIIPGSDGAGVIIEVGEGMDAARLGSEVIINPALNWGDDPRVQGPAFNILGLPRHGTYAEKVAIPEANALPKPKGFSWEDAAAIGLASLTAYRALVTRARVQPGETVLITGIGGGVSCVALQIAKSMGCRVLVTSGSDEKLAKARHLGADEGVNYNRQDWEQAILKMTGGRGPEVVLDSVGGDTLSKCLEVIQPAGRLVTYGATTGSVKDLEIRPDFL
jgi:zinc-binding alcohol dehydrogenase/oxidoreductase